MHDFFPLARRSERAEGRGSRAAARAKRIAPPDVHQLQVVPFMWITILDPAHPDHDPPFSRSPLLDFKTSKAGAVHAAFATSGSINSHSARIAPVWSVNTARASPAQEPFQITGRRSHSCE